MSESIRFHLDEHMDEAIAEALRRADVDVTTTNEAGLRTTKDPTQFGYAIRTGRVLVTGDFRLIPIIGDVDEHPGIVFVPRARLKLTAQIRGILLIHELISADEMVNRIEWVN